MIDGELEVIDGKLEVIDGKLASPGVGSEYNRPLWKSKQTYINFAYPRKWIFLSYVILSFVCLDWLVELYVNIWLAI